MMQKISIYIILLYYCFGVTCPGQSAVLHYKFDHLTVDNGLSSNRIWCIYRDSKDYLWISTDVGLDKYDCYQVKKYRTDDNTPGSISNNQVTIIYEDRHKNLWFGASAGLNLYNPGKDNFKVFKNIPGDKNSINGNYICGITEDSKGNLWVLSNGNCLNRFNFRSGTFTRYPFSNENDRLYPRPARMLGCDSNGKLWVLSLDQIIRCFDPETGKFSIFKDPINYSGTPCLKSVFIDKKDKLWITTDGNGFFSFDSHSRKFERFGTSGDGKGTNQNIILDVIPENDRYLLIGSDQGGINRFDKVTGQFSYYMYNKANDLGLNNNGIWCFHKDRENILWVGTSGGGINYYNPNKERFKLFRHEDDNPNSLTYSFTGCFFKDHEGMIWIGTDGGGINVYNPKNSTFKVYFNSPSDPYSISGNVIRKIVEDQNHDMWIATWDAGLNRFDRKTGKFYHYMPDNKNPSSISCRSIWNLIIDHNNILWLANYNGGIDLFDIKKGVFKRFRANSGNAKAISNNMGFLITEDNTKNIWICTENGLNLYDSISGGFKVFNFPDNEIRSFHRDKKGFLWVGSDTKGIFYCDSNGRILKNYNVSCGLPNNRIQAIVEDNRGDLWISTSEGLSHLDIKTKKFRNYTKEDGLQGNQFFQQSFMKTKEGEIFFGGYNGFNSFYPDSLKNNTQLPKIYITDFQLFNKSVTSGIAGSQFETNISEAKSIQLYWYQSVFSFSFTAVNYTNPERNQYAYRMEGFEKEWNYTNSSRRYVTYTNLDPGKYTFHVKASNNDELWNDKGVSLDIIILPPWWQALWFKLAVLIFIMACIYFAYYLRVRFYQRKQLELSILVEERTKEITASNILLLERQAQIEEQSKELHEHSRNLKEANDLLVQNQNLIKLQTDELLKANNELLKLNSTKDRIFSIIAHDLRNPFNVVSGFSEILLTRFHRLTPEKITRYLNLIYSSSQNGNSLLENLLQWSRSQSGSITFEPIPLNLYNIAEEVSKFLEGVAHKKNISIELQIDTDAMVVADVNMLKTIIRNLLSNAIKFTGEGGKIYISHVVKAHESEICVRDTGVGIPEDKIPMLFNIETNNSTRGTSQESGTGLGLVLCKDFIEKHKGKIWYEPDKNQGSRFIFTIPLS